MAAALQHSSTTQCTGLSAPGTGSDAALFGCFGYATATEQGWCVGAAETNLRTGTDPGGRSLHDGQPKVFRDSAVENLREFFDRFRRLNIRSSPELDALVEQAQQTINGIEPQTLRDSNRLRQMVANDFSQIEAAVGDLLVDRPRRNILRRGGVGGAA